MTRLRQGSGEAAPKRFARRRESRLALWLPVGVYMAVIFFLSSIEQPPPIPSAFPLADKGVHGVLYAGFGLVLLRAFAGGRWTGVTFLAALWSAISAGVYGVTDEIHQLFVPGRQYDVNDMLADAIGASIAVLAVLAWAIIRRYVVRESARRA